MRKGSNPNQCSRERLARVFGNMVPRQILIAILLSCFAIAQPPSRIQSIVTAGSLHSMRWRNFSDYRVWLQKFYDLVRYATAWLHGNVPSSPALVMIGRFRDAAKNGLEPEDHDGSRWKDRVQGLKGAGGDPSAFDVALSVCTMRYVSDLHIGRINPKHFNFGLDIDHKKYDLAHFVRERLLTAKDIPALLDTIEPPFPGYRRTEQALDRYVQLACQDNGEKLPVPAKAIDPGQQYAGVPRLSRLLRLIGDLPPDANPSDPQIYDATLAEGVKRFQRRHRLGEDGRLGAATVNQLNVPLSERVRQLQLTLERWRWLPSEFAAPPIIVNVPDFHLRALDDKNTVTLDMRVVVGKALRTQTPVFSRDMTFVVLRPYWNVPPSILRGEIVPAIKRDRSYIAKKNYEVTTIDGKVVTSGAISDEVLAQLQAGELAVRQKPGSNNALGLVKLIFPNEHNVYLHSTPSPQLFARTRRDFSHGCIRVEKPAELAAWVLRNNPGWTLDRVQQGMKEGSDNVTVGLTQRVPVFIVYATALAYENNEVHFYHDIYGHDAKLAQALAKGYPYS